MVISTGGCRPLRRKVDLFIARHAEAGKSLTDAQKDTERPLTAEGRKEADAIGEFAEKLGIRFDEVVSSPLRRSKETAEAVLKRQKKKLKLELWDELRPEGEQGVMLTRLAAIGHGSQVLVVGHDPYLSTLIGDMIGSGQGTIVLKKGGLARIRITTFSPHAKGELRWLLSPRILKQISSRV